MPGIAHHHQQPNIWLAASEGRTADVEAALKSGGINGAPMDPNAHDENGYTALHAAASYAHLDLIQLLLTKFGADANVTDFDGDTPLHVTETVDAAKMLIDLGADPTQRNNAGRLPIECAYTEEWTELVEYLSQFTPTYRKFVNSDDDEEVDDDDDDDEHVDNEDDDDDESEMPDAVRDRLLAMMQQGELRMVATTFDQAEQGDDDDGDDDDDEEDEDDDEDMQ